jgi:(1->4)-alpha-D-glucan 1-alpha-D-glucosylmutase
LPIAASGTFGECLVSFARELEGRWIVVIAPRLSSRIGFPPIGELWKDTAIEWPETFPREKVRDIFTGRELKIDGRQLNLAHALASLPFAVITNVF